MFEWALGNTQVILFGLIGLGLIVTVTVLSGIGRRKIARLRDEVTELSGRVNALEMIEQRRFLMELKSNGEAPTVAPTAEVGSVQAREVLQQLPHTPPIQSERPARVKKRKPRPVVQTDRGFGGDTSQGAASVPTLK
jgi:hypothetical protein